MLVDSGADLTILPTYLAAFLGLKWSRENKFETVGIGGNVKLWIVKDVPIRIGKLERKIPVGITEQRVPPLLGRHEALETFNVTFNYKEKTIFEN